jgi:CO/xanthine dehydrogenase Mo-binding subunit
MDKIAKKLGMDPLDLRLKNTIKNGMAFPYKQVLESGVCADDVLTRAAELSKYREKRARYAREASAAELSGDRYRRGIGISVALHGGGFTGSAEDTMGTTTRVAYEDGIFTLYTTSVDMGQGAFTVLPQIAAEALGVGIDRVRHPLPDTYVCPNSGPTVASRSTMFIGRALHRTCVSIVSRLRDFLAGRENADPAAVSFEDGVFILPSGRTMPMIEAAEKYAGEFGALDETYRIEPTGVSAWDAEKFEGDAYKGYAWIAQAVEVEVDMDTYEANPVHATVVAEVGRAINPTLASGQLEGGVLQGCGWSHIESLEINDKGGYSASHMSEYLVPTFLDAPTWNVEMLEAPCETGPFGAKGIGELPANGGAPAFLSAVENATGVFAPYIPLTGEKLWMELKKPRGSQYEPPKDGEPR